MGILEPQKLGLKGGKSIEIRSAEVSEASKILSQVEKIFTGADYILSASGN